MRFYSRTSAHSMGQGFRIVLTPLQSYGLATLPSETSFRPEVGAGEKAPLKRSSPFITVAYAK